MRLYAFAKILLLSTRCIQVLNFFVLKIINIQTTVQATKFSRLDGLKIKKKGQKMNKVQVKIFALNKIVEIPSDAFVADESEKKHKGGKINLDNLDDQDLKSRLATIAAKSNIVTCCIIDQD